MNDMWLQHFSTIPDPRTGNRKVHKLIDILAIAIIATLCGEDDWVGVEEFARSREDWLRTFLELPYGLPSHDTFGRVFSLLSPEAFEQAFMAWTQEIFRLTQGAVIAIDGKTLRRSHDQANGRKRCIWFRRGRRETGSCWRSAKWMKKPTKSSRFRNC